MAIIDDLLADFETPSGTRYRIEYNDNGYIHLHTEHVRLDLTPDEFLEIADTVVEGRQQLIEIKNEL